MRVCCKCLKTKPFEFFYKARNGYNSTCVKCLIVSTPREYFKIGYLKSLELNRINRKIDKKKLEKIEQDRADKIRELMS